VSGLARLSRTYLLAVVVGLLVVGVTVHPVAAQADAAGAIIGTVTNGTAGASAPADLEVVVHVLTNRQKTGEQRVRTDGAGRFRVEGLATGPDMLYFTVVEYGGVAYFPDRPILFQTPEPQTTDITVFESTPIAEGLAFERLNMLVIDVTPTAMTVMEMGSVNNVSDKTFAADPQVTGSARTLRFALPPGATDIAPQAGLPQDSLESTPDGFASTDPVKPGRREIAFSYELPYQSAALDLTRRFALPVGAFTVYLPGDQVQLIGPGLTVNGTAELGGRTFRRFEIQNVTPGTDVRFRLSGLPAPFFGNPRDLGLAVTGAAAVALVAFVLLAMRRRKRGAVTDAGTRETAVDGAQNAVLVERQALVRSVAELDERFAAGSLDEDAYREQRDEQKARLVALSRSPADA
jgi:hypothetical protein